MGTVFLLAACADVRNIPITEVEARPEYEAIASALEDMIERERDQKGLRALSIALVDGNDIVGSGLRRAV